MTEQTVPPDLSAAEKQVEALYQDVLQWEGSLAGGRELKLSGRAVDSLFQTKVEFGNPRDKLTWLTKERFALSGVVLSDIQALQIDSRYCFYYLTLTINMQPKPGAVFKSLNCRLEFGPKGEDEPIVQAIFPTTQWHTVINWGGGLNLGLNGDLEWEAGVDASQLAAVAGLPGSLKAKVVNKNEMRSFIVMPDYAYENGRLDIAAGGEGGSNCFWQFQQPDLQKTTSVQLGVVFKVPKGTPTVTLYGIAWAEPSMNWLVVSLQAVRNSLKQTLRTLLQQKENASSQLARGTSETWTLELPII